MIKINLLPQELHVKKKTPATGKPAFPWKSVAIGAGILFIVGTLWLDLDYIHSLHLAHMTAKDWDSIKPELQTLRKLEGEVEKALIPDRDFLRANVLNKAPITQVLQEMNNALPGGMWLTSFDMNNSGQERSFKIQGLAIAYQKKTEIEQIEEYLQVLKTVIPNSQFTYSTAKQVVDQAPAIAFTADYRWQAT